MMAARVQLDLFAWATPRQKVQRSGFCREMVVCKIGPNWWFAPYLVICDGGKVVPDLRASLLPTFHQFRPACRSLAEDGGFCRVLASSH